MAGFLLIGGAGFIGSHLVHRLVADGHEVVVVDDRRRYAEAAAAGHEAVHAWREAELLGGATLHEATAGDGSVVQRVVAAQQPDVVVQLANLPLATVARDDPAHARASIVGATAGVLDAIAAGGGVRRLLYVSSSMVYGDFACEPMPEDGPCTPREAYGRLKLEAERLVRRRGAALGMEVTVVRPSAVYGPGDAHGRFIQRLAAAARDGRTLVLTGGGLTRLDFTAVADLAGGIAAASTAPAAAGATINLSRGEARSLADAVTIARDCGFALDVRIEPAADALRPRRGSLDISARAHAPGLRPAHLAGDGPRRVPGRRGRPGRGPGVSADDEGPGGRPSELRRAVGVSADDEGPGGTPSELRRAVGVSAAAIPFFAGAREMAAHGAAYLGAMAEALAGGQALQGPEVAAFEERLAERCGREHAVAVGSGTDALFFALAAHGIGAGDEVLVPAFSFIATASCIVRAGARPVFADVDEAGLLDLEAAAGLCSPRTRAVIAVQLYGQMLEPAALEAFAAQRGLILVEDAAQAFGAAAAGRRAGSVGQASCLSFDPTKTIAAPGSGGAVLCDDAALAARLRRLRWHGRDAQGRFAELGYNSQLPTASAAALLVKLGLDQAWTERRRAIATAYDAALAGTAAHPMPVVPGASHVFHKYVVRVPAARRDGLRARAGRRGRSDPRALRHAAVASAAVRRGRGERRGAICAVAVRAGAVAPDARVSRRSRGVADRGRAARRDRLIRRR